LSGFITVARFIAALAVVGVLGVGVSADSSSAQLTVGVTVVGSCAVDARPASTTSPSLTLRCTTGAQSTLKVSQSPQSSSTVVVSEGSTVLTLNF
jgi:hypothetical protein